MALLEEKLKHLAAEKDLLETELQKNKQSWQQIIIEENQKSKRIRFQKIQTWWVIFYASQWPKLWSPPGSLSLPPSSFYYHIMPWSFHFTFPHIPVLLPCQINVLTDSPELGLGLGIQGGGGLIREQHLIAGIIWCMGLILLQNGPH